MKVGIIGVLDQDKPESTNHHQMKALKDLGYETCGFNYRTVLMELRDSDKAADALKRWVEEDKPNLVLFSKFNQWPTEAIEWVKQQGVKTWYWYMDPMNMLTGQLRDHALAADYASATGVGQVEYFKALGQTNAYHIQEGVDVDVYRPAEEGEDVDYNVAFIGSATHDRVYIIQEINKIEGVGAKAFGPGWPKELGEDTWVGVDEFRQICTNADLVLGRDREMKTRGYFSDRAFRVMACGGVYTTVMPPASEEWLNDGVNCITAPDDEWLLARIGDILVDREADDILAGVRENGPEIVKECHLWTHSMRKLMDIAESEQVVQDMRGISLDDQE